MYSTRRYTLLVTALLLVNTSATPAAERVFEPSAIQDWQPHSFDGETQYELETVQGQPALHAVCRTASASGLVHRAEIDLRETPILEWRWRVEQTYGDIDETRKSGDDYPARIYVVDEYSIARWRTRAVNYVWSSGHDKGEHWPNAYASQAHMIAVRDASDAGTGWHAERRNVLADFARFHDRKPDTVEVVAIMTDCDDTGQTGEAWYGAIGFHPESR